MKLSNALIITVLLVCLSGFAIQAQIPVLGSESLLDKLRLNKGIKGNETALYPSITGDNYIFSNFQKGKLIVNTGEKFDVEIRYDIYANEMHLKDNDQIYAIIHPERVKLIDVDSLKFIYSNFVKTPGEENSGESSYFIVKTDGRCKLLIKKNIRIQDVEPAKLYQEEKPAKFIITKDTYYLKLEDKNAIKIKNKKMLLSALSDEKVVLNKFISSNKLGIKDVNHLVRIVSYYNDL